ncbi:unnamed protein product [Pylaiella littoralis]
MRKKEKKIDNNGLCTSTLGSSGWFSLHCVAAGHPVDPDEYDDIRGNMRGHTKHKYIAYFKSAGHVLPCRFCRESYLVVLTEIPIEKYIHSRQNLYEWLFIVHNKVNEKIGDKQETSLQAVVDKYKKLRATCSPSSKSLGCTEPAIKNAKMSCRLVIEPVDRFAKRRMVGACVAAAVVVVVIALVVVARK